MKYVNTHGEVYHTALQQSLVGCYLLILLLALLFALSAGGEFWFIGPICLLALLLLFCIVYHSLLNNALPKFDNCKRGGDPVQASSGLIGNPLVKLFSRYLGINTQKYPEAGIEEQLDDMPSLKADWEKYFPPSVITTMPTIWVPRDSHGHSVRQIEESLYLGIPMTNEGARLDGNDKIHLDKDHLPL